MRLYLIRHGQTWANVAGELDTAYPGVDLTDLGRAQAEALVGALAGETLAGVHASPLLRARLTAAPVAAAHGHEVEVQEGVEEISAGDLELRADDEAVAAYLGTLATWIRGDLDRRVPGGHDGHAFLERYDAGVRAVCARHGRDDTVVIVSHGAAIRTYTALRTSSVDAVDWTERRIMNTGAVLLEGSPDHGWAVARWSSDPLGGAALTDLAAHDVTGDAPEAVAP